MGMRKSFIATSPTAKDGCKRWLLYLGMKKNRDRNWRKRPSKEGRLSRERSVEVADEPATQTFGSKVLATVPQPLYTEVCTLTQHETAAVDVCELGGQIDASRQHSLGRTAPRLPKTDALRIGLRCVL